MRERDVVALVLIWSGVFAGAFLLVLLAADDDPATDDAAGAGMLAAVVGAVLTGIYFAVVEFREQRRRRAMVVQTAPAQATDAEARRVSSLRRNWVDIVAAVGLWIVGTTIALAARVPDGVAAWVGGALPLAFLLARHVRRSRS